MAKSKRRLTKAGKVIVAIVAVLMISLGIYGTTLLFSGSNDDKKVEVINTPTTQNEEEVTVDADKYNEIYTKYSALNEDYIGYLEWKNNLLYDYGDEKIDPYPNVIVRSKIVEDGEGNVDDANNEYMRHDITHEERSFGQDFMDGENAIDSNGNPTDQNVIVYGHYVYPEKYGVDNLKFTPLHKLKDPSVYEQYDTFTLTFKSQQRTYQVAHAFLYNKSLFNNRQNSPLALNYSVEEFNVYMDKIANLYGDFLDTGVSIEPTDNFITLQTCVEGRDDQLFFVVAKEINRVDF